MTFPEYKHAVFRICDKDQAAKFGTGFVVHVVRRSEQISRAFVVTCAHVLTDGENAITLAEQSATVVGKGDRDGLDLAVISVDLESAKFRSLHALPIAGVGSLDDDCVGDSDEQLQVVGYRPSDNRFRRVPLIAAFGRYEHLEIDNGVELRLIQFRLPQDASIEPHELKCGYSGSPLLSGSGVCGVMDARRATAGEGTHKVGSAFPLWLLAKIWPGMAPDVGRQLFGMDYWTILEALRPRSWSGNVLWGAFRKAVDRADPEDDSLWGYAVTMRGLEKPDHPTRLLRRFVRALAESAKCPELVDVLPSLAEEPATALPVLSPEKVYRRLIIRILERRLSSRGASQRGKRYEIEVHTATCEGQDENCCGRDCIDCTPAAVGKLETVKARTLDETSEAGLGPVLQAEIRDLLEIFRWEQPDLFQIVAPEGLLPYLIFEAQLDQIPARGPMPLLLLQPTVFSGQCRSDANSDGHYLLPRLGEHRSRWTGRFKIIESAGEFRQLYKQLDDTQTAIAITTDRNVTDKCLYTHVPIIVVARDQTEQIQQTILDTDCLWCLPRTLHNAYHPLSLVYDTPNVPIHFAEDEEPVIGSH